MLNQASCIAGRSCAGRATPWWPRAQLGRALDQPLQPRLLAGAQVDAIVAAPGLAGVDVAGLQAQGHGYGHSATQLEPRVARGRDLLALPAVGSDAAGVWQEHARLAHMRRAASPGARMAFVCWRPLAENPRIGVPMHAVSPHVPPRPKADPRAPGMFAFADPQRVSQVLTAAGWAPPRLDKLDLDLDIAAGRGLEEAVVQSTQIGAVNSWLRGQPAEVVAAAVASIREALAAHLDGASVRLPGAMWLVSSATA
jgi:hypothetical protein